MISVFLFFKFKGWVKNILINHLMYGIWVIGHSGAGKTTLVKGMG